MSGTSGLIVDEGAPQDMRDLFKETYARVGRELIEGQA